MKWLRDWIEKFKKKSKSQKAFDLLFYLLIVLILLPDGRILLRRSLLQLPFMGPNIEVSQSLDQQDIESLLHTEGESAISLSQFDGQVLFIHHWATWCGPCKAELPELAELYARYKDNPNIKFLFISYEDLEITRAFLKKNDLALPAARLSSNPTEILSAPGIPTSIIVNKNRQIVLKKVGMANWTGNSFYQQLDSLISE